MHNFFVIWPTLLLRIFYPCDHTLSARKSVGVSGAPWAREPPSDGNPERERRRERSSEGKPAERREGHSRRGRFSFWRTGDRAGRGPFSEGPCCGGWPERQRGAAGAAGAFGFRAGGVGGGRWTRERVRYVAGAGLFGGAMAAGNRIQAGRRPSDRGARPSGRASRSKWRHPHAGNGAAGQSMILRDHGRDGEPDLPRARAARRWWSCSLRKSVTAAKREASAGTGTSGGIGQRFRATLENKARACPGQGDRISSAKRSGLRADRSLGPAGPPRLERVGA